MVGSAGNRQERPSGSRNFPVTQYLRQLSPLEKRASGPPNAGRTVRHPLAPLAKTSFRLAYFGLDLRLMVQVAGEKIRLQLWGNFICDMAAKRPIEDEEACRTAVATCELEGIGR